MPTFKNVYAGAAVQAPDVAGSFIRGQAASMAYRSAKQQEAIAKEQATAMAYANTPEQRDLVNRKTRAASAQMEAQAFSMMNPSADFGTQQIREGDEYVTYETVNGRPSREIGRSPIRTGTEADPALGKRATGQVETQIIDLQNAMNEVNRMNLEDADDLLTYQGRIKSFVAKQADKMGVASDKQIKRIHMDQELRGQVRQAFQKIRKAVTGAQAAHIELVYLEEAYFSDRMTPTQLRSAKKVFVESTQAAIDVLINLKQQGFTPGTQEFGTAFDDQWQRVKPKELNEIISDFRPKEPAAEGGKDLGGGFSLTFD